MSVFFEHQLIDDWINEDAPLLDLTSHTLQLSQQPARMQFVARNAYTIAGTEEVQRIVQHCQGEQVYLLASGTGCEAGQVILSCTGPAHALLRAWKVGQNLLEFACGVATQTRALVDSVKAINPDIAVLTTRKHAPGLRKLALKATLAGGAMPHRLGLSETILIFPQHRALLGSWKAVKAHLQRQQGELSEKKIVIEVQDMDEAKQAIDAGANALQFDKVPPQQLREWAGQLRQQYPDIHLLAAGGIKADNAKLYADTGVHALVTSSLYYAAAADIGVRITPA